VLQLGRVALPGALVTFALDAGLRHSAFAPEFAQLKRSVSRVRLAPDALRLTYTWQPELLASARALALTPAEQEGLAAAHERLVDVMNRVGEGRRQAELADVLGPLLLEAGERPARTGAPPPTGTPSSSSPPSSPARTSPCWCRRSSASPGR
jgi:hypothetical protein